MVKVAVDTANTSRLGSLVLRMWDEWYVCWVVVS